MVSIQIQNIQLKTKIQECLIIIDSKSFKVFYQNNNYIVSPEQEINEQKNNAVSNDSNSATSNIVESSESPKIKSQKSAVNPILQRFCKYENSSYFCYRNRRYGNLHCDKS